MKLFITILIALAVAVGLALVSMDDPGYIVLTRDPYVIRMPLLLFALVIFVAFMLFYLLFNFISGVMHAPKKYGKWRVQKKENSAQKQTMQGYTRLIEGDWAKAEEALLQKLEYNKTPLMNYLGAAYSAQQQGQLGRRDQYFDEALAKHPSHDLAINLTRARLHYQAGELSESRNFLEALRTTKPRNAPILRLLADVYQKLGDWHSLVGILPEMKKLKILPEDELIQREQLAYDSLIDSPALQHGESSSPEAYFNALPAARRKDPVVVGSYAKQLIKSGDMKMAEKVLRTALNRGFDSKLIRLYGQVHSPFLTYQIELAESFNKNHDSNVELLLTLARLYRQNNEIEKAKDHYKRAIAAGARDDAYLDMGSLFEQAGETEAALQFYKQGVAALLPESNLEQKPIANKGALLTELESNEAEIMPVVR